MSLASDILIKVKPGGGRLSIEHAVWVEDLDWSRIFRSLQWKIIRNKWVEWGLLIRGHNFVIMLSELPFCISSSPT